jgi:hypothetical protein
MALVIILVRLMVLPAVADKFPQYFVAKRMLQYATALKCLSLELWLQISLDRKYVHKLVYMRMQILMFSFKKPWSYSILIYLIIRKIWKVASSCPASQWTPCEDSLEHFQQQMRKKRSTDYFHLEVHYRITHAAYKYLINSNGTHINVFCVHKNVYISFLWFVMKTEGPSLGDLTAAFPLNSYIEITLITLLSTTNASSVFQFL